MLRPINSVSKARIRSQWDALAPVRYRQIVSGQDVTYVRVLTPAMLSLVPERTRTVLDAGCGIGFLTQKIAARVPHTIGIDPSEASISIAVSEHGSIAEFARMTMEEYARAHSRTVELVVANMVLMDVLSLKRFLDAAAQALIPEGRLLFSITHPCFWPSYRGYADEPWFDYATETVIEGPFRISADTGCDMLSVHVHRPLHAYFDALREVGFRCELLEEPLPSKDTNLLYPEPWTYPRYLIARCIRL